MPAAGKHVAPPIRPEWSAYSDRFTTCCTIARNGVVAFSRVHAFHFDCEAHVAIGALASNSGRINIKAISTSTPLPRAPKACPMSHDCSLGKERYLHRTAANLFQVTFVHLEA